MMKHVFGGPNYKTIEGKLDMYTWPCLIWEPNSVEPENRKGVHVFLRFTEGQS